MSITSQNGCDRLAGEGGVLLEEGRGGLGADHHREVRRGVRGIEPRRPGRRLHPVDDAADHAVAPQQVAVAEVAVQERRLVRRLGAGQHLEGPPPRVGVLCPRRHDPLRLPRPRLVGGGTARPAAARGSWRAGRPSRGARRGRPRTAARRAAATSGARRHRRPPRPRRARCSWEPARPSRRGRPGPSCSRAVSSAPWVRHGSLVISRSTDSEPSSCRRASILDVIPPSSRSWEATGEPAAEPAQSRAAGRSSMRRR